jgi:hypothetical protein
MCANHDFMLKMWQMFHRISQSDPIWEDSRLGLRISPLLSLLERCEEEGQKNLLLHPDQEREIRGRYSTIV